MMTFAASLPVPRQRPGWAGIAVSCPLPLASPDLEPFHGLSLFCYDSDVFEGVLPPFL